MLKIECLQYGNVAYSHKNCLWVQKHRTWSVAAIATYVSFKSLFLSNSDHCADY